MDKLGRTRLILAVLFNKPQLWKLLLGTPGCNPAIQSNEGWSALHYACMKNFPDAVRSLVRSDNTSLPTLNQRASNGDRPLHIAADNG